MSQDFSPLETEETSSGKRILFISFILLLVIGFVLYEYFTSVPDYQKYYTKADYDQAYALALPKAEKGDKKAQYLVGLMNLDGSGTKQNTRDAVKWLAEAAEKGFAEAQYKLGEMAELGKGIPVNLPEAVKLYTAASNEGLPKAQYRLALMLINGLGVNKDETEAIKWLKMSAENDESEAQCLLGGMYSIGTPNLKKNIVEATRLLKLSMVKGNKEAPAYLSAVMSSQKPDRKELLELQKYIIAAAESGNAISQYQLGTLYYEGNIIRRDKVQAYKWLCLAASQGIPGALAKRDAVAAEMTKNELQKAHNMAVRWKPAEIKVD